MKVREVLSLLAVAGANVMPGSEAWTKGNDIDRSHFQEANDYIQKAWQILHDREESRGKRD